MNVTVLGANGHVGQLVVADLLQHGHRVTAFVHSSSSLPSNPDLTIARGDVHVADDIENAITGGEAIISCLGSWHTPEKNILSSAVQQLIPLMKARGITRLISLTGAGAQAPQDNPSAFDSLQHALFNFGAPKVLRDGEDHIQLLSESALDWTVVRSPVMNNYGQKTYKLSSDPPKPWQTINRSAVAHCMVDQLEDKNFIRQAPFITRK